MLLVTLTFSILGGSTWLVITWCQKKSNFTENTIDTIAAVKGKYCSRITWK